MTWFALTIASIAAAAWAGAILFQSAIVAPRIFTSLDEPSARTLLRELFPRFFRLGATCGVIIAVAVAVAGALAAWPSSFLVLLGCGAAIATLALFSARMVPAINAARDAGPDGAARFERLHRASVLLTVVGLGIALTFLAVVARLAASAAAL